MASLVEVAKAVPRVATCRTDSVTMDWHHLSCIARDHDSWNLDRFGQTCRSPPLFTTCNAVARSPQGRYTVGSREVKHLELGGGLKWMGVLHDQECCSTIRLVNWVAECPTQPLGRRQVAPHERCRAQRGRSEALAKRVFINTQVLQFAV